MRRTVWKELVDESMLKIRGHQMSAKRCLQNLLKTLTARITPQESNGNDRYPKISDSLRSLRLRACAVRPSTK